MPWDSGPALLVIFLVLGSSRKKAPVSLRWLHPSPRAAHLGENRPSSFPSCVPLDQFLYLSAPVLLPLKWAGGITVGSFPDEPPHTPPIQQTSHVCSSPFPVSYSVPENPHCKWLRVQTSWVHQRNKADS